MALAPRPQSTRPVRAAAPAPVQRTTFSPEQLAALERMNGAPAEDDIPAQNTAPETPAPPPAAPVVAQEKTVEPKPRKALKTVETKQVLLRLPANIVDEFEVWFMNQDEFRSRNAAGQAAFTEFLKRHGKRAD